MMSITIITGRTIKQDVFETRLDLQAPYHKISYSPQNLTSESLTGKQNGYVVAKYTFYHLMPVRSPPKLQKHSKRWLFPQRWKGK